MNIQELLNRIVELKACYFIYLNDSGMSIEYGVEKLNSHIPYESEWFIHHYTRHDLLRFIQDHIESQKKQESQSDRIAELEGALQKILNVPDNKKDNLCASGSDGTDACDDMIRIAEQALKGGK